MAPRARDAYAGLIARVSWCALLVACTEARSSAPSHAATASVAPPAADAAPIAIEPIDAGLAPLAAPDVSAALPVPGFGDAVITLPLGVTRPRPIVVAMHGLWDRPEWECAAWNAVVFGRAFVVCPRGVKSKQATADDPRLTYDSAAALDREVDAAIGALRAAYPAYTDDGPVIFTGFSLGAIYGVPCMARSPSRYPLGILTEGGHYAWTVGAATAFAKGGGKRVAFLCGTDDCAKDAEGAVQRLTRAGVAVKLRFVKGQGHTYGGALFEASKEEIAWVLAADPRFAE